MGASDMARVSMMSKRTDGNHVKMVGILRAAGCSIQDLNKVGGGCPDLLVGICGVNVLVEIKNPETKGKLSKRQKEWHSEWRGKRPFVISSLDDVARFLSIQHR